MEKTKDEVQTLEVNKQELTLVQHLLTTVQVSGDGVDIVYGLKLKTKALLAQHEKKDAGKPAGA